MKAFSMSECINLAVFFHCFMGCLWRAVHFIIYLFLYWLIIFCITSNHLDWILTVTAKLPFRKGLAFILPPTALWKYESSHCPHISAIIGDSPLIIVIYFFGCSDGFDLHFSGCRWGRVGIWWGLQPLSVSGAQGCRLSCAVCQVGTTGQ